MGIWGYKSGNVRVWECEGVRMWECEGVKCEGPRK